MELKRIHQIAASANDLGQTKDFYTNTLGARFIAEYNPPGLLFYDFNGTRILFEQNSPSAVLYFWVDDIEAAHNELSGKGVSFESGPHLIHKDDDGTFGAAGQEEWMAFFKDPGGNTLAIATRR